MTDLDQIDQNSNALGNTESSAPKSKQAAPCFFWCFTFNNYEEDQIDQIVHIMSHECEWYLFQEEKGEEGTLHLQGVLKLKKKARLTQLKKWNTKIHWEPTKHISASIAYCSKVETRCGRMWSKGVQIPEELEIDQPYGWQLQVMDIVNSKPDKRTIWWFWEPSGNVGKTTLCKYLVVKHDALMVTGKSNDMYHMISKHPNKRKLIVCDIPRSSLEYINYPALEQIKNGLIFSGKYEGCQLVFNCPHVIIFANEPPDERKMSLDRWQVVRIDSELQIA